MWFNINRTDNGIEDAFGYARRRIMGCNANHTWRQWKQWNNVDGGCMLLQTCAKHALV